jgi:hypothetical protein
VVKTIHWLLEQTSFKHKPTIEPRDFPAYLGLRVLIKSSNQIAVRKEVVSYRD